MAVVLQQQQQQLGLRVLLRQLVVQQQLLLLLPPLLQRQLAQALVRQLQSLTVAAMRPLQQQQRQLLPQTAPRAAQPSTMTRMPSGASAWKQMKPKMEQAP